MRIKGRSAVARLAILIGEIPPHMCDPYSLTHRFNTCFEGEVHNMFRFQAFSPRPVANDALLGTTLWGNMALSVPSAQQSQTSSLALAIVPVVPGIHGHANPPTQSTD